ncbi:hypothetical protein GCM10008090_07010 [Arenicella chitinivorans]|uniref:Lipoprotein n=1 Tax=Arenicella chitinivorans TaxID=1329800 RepID=A0A918RKL5_9GAMM|nr:hypothetical protein [Arenicella chitinivorans]GHA00665.1 hypothetical protein GCM10008090_07010 [Arenicella chitinivorans]
MKLYNKTNFRFCVVSTLSLLLGACSNEPPEHMPASASRSSQTEVVNTVEHAVSLLNTSPQDPALTAELTSSQRVESAAEPSSTANSEDELELHVDDTLYENFEAPAETVALVPLTSNRVEWSSPLERSYERVTVTLVGPDGVLNRREFAPGQSIEWDSGLQDGLYTWESVLSPEVDPYVREQMNQVRSQGNLEAEQALLARLRSEGSLPSEEQGNQNRQSGTFTVVDGVVRPTLVDVQKEVVDR